MKDLLTKIKTLDYKQFALQHGEKIGLGVIGLVAVICLGMTNWASDFSGTPEDMERAAAEVDRKLKSNPWPETAKNEFLPTVTADAELGRVLAAVDLKKFEWTTPYSPKLYPKQLPADEVDWIPVTKLYARSGQMPMAVSAPPPSDSLADEPVERKPAKPAKEKKGASAAEGLTLSSMHSAGSGGGGAGMAGYGAMSAEKARGVRFNVVVGVVNVQEQYKSLRNKLHLDSVQQAKPYLEYIGFELERQRAVPGSDPWAGPWKRVNTDSSMEILGEASDFDPEIVSASATNGEFTSPLPKRLDADWDPNKVGHPAIPTLTEEQQEAQDAENRAFSKVAGEEDADATGGRQGFSRIQKDANKLRDRALSRPDGAAAVAEVRNRMAAMYGAGGGRSGHAGGTAVATGPAGHGGARGGMPPAMNMGAMPGGGNMGMLMGRGGAGMMGTAETEADLLLFRYFDFDVEPGECYRYRVRLITKNPSFGETFVNGQNVAEGEMRESPWSVPSTATAVDKDVEYALLKASEKGGRRDGADLEVVQFDPTTGTLISDKFKVLFGAYVGAEKRKTPHLNLAVPSFDDEEISFRSQDVLLDSAAAPNLSESVKKDLNLSPKKLRELSKQGELDLAVTVNRFGEIVDLDADSNSDIKPALTRVKEEREPYKDLKEPVKRKSETAEDPSNMYGPRRRKKSDEKNPLKAGGGGYSPGMPMPGSVAPGPGSAGFRGGRGKPAGGPRND